MATGISRDEINLYDRQIRLWGIEGQTRLREARILVLGFGALAVETVKNLALAGVGSLTLQSSETVSEQSLGANFFVRAENIGMNVAEAARVRVQRLNPRVAVVAETKSVGELDGAWIAGFDVVIATQLPLAESQRINRITRAASKAFYAGTVQGWAGFIFVDLVDHEFVVERQRSNVATQLGSVSKTQTVVSVDIVDENTERLKVREAFVSLDDAIAAATTNPLGATLKPRQRARVSPYLPAFLASGDATTLTSADLAAKCEAMGLPRTLASAEFVSELSSSYGVQLSAVASVVGGLLAQEAINFLTLREFPIQNMFVYDAKRSQGPIYHLF